MATSTPAAAATQAARDAMYARFEDEVDPDRRLTSEERGKRVDNARSAHYARIARMRGRDGQQ